MQVLNRLSPQGPLFRPSAAETVAKQIRDAVDKGAILLVGEAADQAAGDYSTLIQPTVLSGISTKMDIWERESFGPGERSHQLASDLLLKQHNLSHLPDSL